jgi:SNF2-related domain
MYKLSTGDAIRHYQLRAAHKVFTGTPLRNNLTGEYMPEQPTRDGTEVHIDMGLGKTVIALTAIADWYRFGVITNPVLVVAPIKVCETVWRREAAEWAHTCHLTFSLLRGNVKERAFALARKAHIYLINPEGLVWIEQYLREDWSYFDALIIDESSMFKDHRSKRFKAISRYGRRIAEKGDDGKALRDSEGRMIRMSAHRFKRTAVMTGTPCTSSLMNLWSPSYICDHGARLHADFDTFQGRFFHKTQEVADHIFKFDINAEEAESRPSWQAREGAPMRIHELLADITVELNAEDYGVLPRTIGDASKATLENPIPPSHLHRVELPDAIRGYYDQLEKDAIIELKDNTIMAQNGGAKSMMCWQIANGFLYKRDDFGRQEAQELHQGKLDMLCGVIEEVNTNTLIPYYFKHDFVRITERLHKEHIPFVVMPKKNSQRVIDQWNEGRIPNLLMHPMSESHGLNIQFGGHTIIWYTLLWSLDRYLQMNARLARSGQKNIVGIHHIVASRTTDELMLSNLRQNGNDQQRFRAALREYQTLRGFGLYQGNVLEGLL